MRMSRIANGGALLGVGLIGGMVLGLLLAPASGARTRRRLTNDALRAADVARDVAEKAEHAADVLAKRVDHYLGRDEEVAWRKIQEIREGVQRYSKTVTS